MYNTAVGDYRSGVWGKCGSPCPENLKKLIREKTLQMRHHLRKLQSSIYEGINM